jgi:hypothetical protein
MDSSIATQYFGYASSETVVDMLAEFGACVFISTDSNVDDTTAPSPLCNAEMPTCATIRYLEQGLKEHPGLIDNFSVSGQSGSLLLYAAAKGFEHIARLCVKETTIAHRQQALIVAVRGRINPVGRMSIIRCLVEAGLQLEQSSSHDMAMLLFDVINQPYNEDDVSLLLSTSSFNLEIKNSKGLTVLFWAIQQGRKSYVKMFLSPGADLMARSTNGATTLILAAKAGELSSFRCILDCEKFEPDARDMNGRTALSRCVTVADACATTMVSELLKRLDVDPNSKEASGQTVLNASSEIR